MAHTVLIHWWFSGIFKSKTLVKEMWWGRQGWEGWSWTYSKWVFKCQCPWCPGGDCCSVVAVYSHLNSHQLPAVTVICVDSVWMRLHFVLTILNLTAFVCLILLVCCVWCECACVCVTWIRSLRYSMPHTIQLWKC